MILFCPLASGSKGNCLFLSTPQTKILIDAGISGKQIAQRLEQLGVRLEEIEAVLVTHEHQDHIEGLKVLGKKNIPVFANMETARGIYQNLQLLPTFKIFSTGEVFSYKDLTILPVGVQHDTLDPVGFVIATAGIKIGICSDLGFVPTLLKKHLENCHCLYVEANHQPSMVMASNRSALYKQRVLGRQGHLSNEECASLLASVWHKDLRHIYLAHLSQECNSPELAKKIVEEKLQEKASSIEISIAYQDQISRAVRFDVIQ